MSAPRKAHKFQSVKIRYTQRLATGVEQTITLCKVTNMMKLMERTLQAATQVKVLSPEIFHDIEADVFHITESKMSRSDMASSYSLYRGLRPWHVMRWKLCELGRSTAFLKRYIRTSYKRRGLMDDVVEVGLTDSTLMTGKPSTWGSGQQCGDGLRSCVADTLRLETYAK